MCPHCDGVNRIPLKRNAAEAKCGKCHSGLFEGHPIQLTQASFEQHISRNDIPVVVDFWASWCGPCVMMEPVFEEAATRVEPHMRLAKVNTEQEQPIAVRYGIRSIPTLIIFKHGQELARQAGAMDLGNLLAWLAQYRGS